MDRETGYTVEEIDPLQPITRKMANLDAIAEFATAVNWEVA
jgi:hypothetical protein